MGIIQRVFGKAQLSDRAAESMKTISAVEAALKAMTEERAAAQSAIAANQKKRAELLLADSSDDQIAELERSSDAHRLTLERAEAIEPKLLARLRNLRTEARNAALEDLLARRDRAVFKFIEQARSAKAARDAVVRFHDEAIAAGFRAEAEALPLVPYAIHDEAGIAHYEAREEEVRELRSEQRRSEIIEKRRAAAEEKSPPPPRPRPPLFTPPRRKAEEALPAPAVEPPLPVWKFAADPITPIKDDAGKVKIVVLRSGVELNGETHRQGETAFLDEDAARTLLMSGAAEYAAA